MFNTAFEQLGMDALYIRLASRNVEEAVKGAKTLGLKGFNITAPYKEDVIPLLTGIEDSVLPIEAINTVQIDAEGLIGHNTDGYGAVRALEEGGANIGQHKFLIIGAGGAAKAVARELMLKGADVTIANRTVEKAKGLGENLGCGFSSMEDAELENAVNNADVIISCVSTLDRIVPKELLKREHKILDANYFNMSALVEDAIAVGSDVVDGMEWLLYQGAKAFEIFTGKQAPIEAMRTPLYEFKRSFKNHNVALIGPMGSGKTVVGEALADKLNATFVDTDNQIQKRLKMSIPEIFEKSGEAAFRENEKQIIADVFHGRRQVVALGGGAILDLENVQRIRESGFSVLLWASLDVLTQRLEDADDRPLLDEEDNKNKLTEIISQRFEQYIGSADTVIDTGQMTVEEVTGLIENEIHSTFGD
jgi:shikimate dehydrogenase